MLSFFTCQRGDFQVSVFNLDLFARANWVNFVHEKLRRTYWKLDIQEMTLDMKIHRNQSILTSPSTSEQHVCSQQPLLTNSFDSVHSSLPPSLATLLTSCSTENFEEAPEPMETEFMSQIIGYGPQR
ncbi:uncharacterized protein LOC131255768 isoform X2 [Magnolia sinica]|uniref:uncharacterized protein LOC131255768 isoform X2 n=1 Tax=Magnolia sinica TaxID=86752 RepID=UPI00265AA444|nr:uncharacterized protein LOC131255768 isoform X2 [Magnolia sinica]